MKRIIAVVLALTILLGCADWSVLQVSATESQEEFFEYYEIVSEAETSAIAMGMYSMDNGIVSRKDSNEIEWIDRLDLSDASCIRDYYNKLAEASDNDGIDDFLIEDRYFAGEVDSNFIENNGNISIIVDTVEGHVSSQDEFSEVMNKTYQTYSKYIIAASNAFDRDHPEVFWITGSVAPGCLASCVPTSGGYDYTLYLTAMLKGTINYSDGTIENFDVRSGDYQNQTTIKSAIDAVETDVVALMNDAAGKNDYEKLVYFNEQLTRNNQYNTSSDLNSIAHECRECISALEGRTGIDGPVCEAYAKAFKVLCDRVDIPCVLVDGYAKNNLSSSGEAHMWNYVQLGDSWYGTDVTWNDPLGGTNGAVSGYETDEWLLVGADTIISNMKFIESHPVSNIVSSGGVSFTNGPQLSDDKYVHVIKTEISAVNSTIGKVYDGHPITVSNEKGIDITWNSDGTLTIDGYYTDIDGADLLESAPKNAGTYYVKVTVSENGSYSETTTMIPIVISKALGSIENKTEGGYQADGSYTYENLPPVPSKDNFAVLGDGEVSFTWYQESVSEGNKLPGMPVSGGKHILVAELSEGKNYTGASLELEIVIVGIGRIENKDYNTKYTYTGESITPPTSSNFTFTGDGTLSFQWYAGDYTNKSLADQMPLGETPTDAGVYTLLASIATGSHYTASEIKICVTIEKAIVIPSISGNAEKIYDGNTTVKVDDILISLDGVFEKDKSKVQVDADYIYADANAGTEITVLATNIQLKGDRSDNYVLSNTTAECTGTIFPKSLAECTIEVKEPVAYFTNEEITPEIFVRDGETELICSQEYLIAYENNISVGTGKIMITGIGNYIGSVEKEFIISYIPKPEIVKRDALVKMGDRFGSDVSVSAEGYLLSDSLSGEYKEFYIISAEDNYTGTIEKDLYFKQIETGYISNKITMSIFIDKAAPTIENISVPTEAEGTLQDVSAQIGFASDEAGTYCYIVKEKNEVVPSVDDFIKKADGTWSVNEGVASETLNADGIHVISVSQLKENTEYVVYFIAIDGLGNASEVKNQPFKTLNSKVYTIYYELDGGNFECEVINSFTTHESVDLSQIIPVRHGYVFAGWYDENDSLVTEIPVGETSGKKLYAKWNISAEFKLKVNAYKMQTSDEQKIILEIPYNAKTGDWTMVYANTVIESDPEGLIINENYYEYKNEAENSEYSLKFVLYKVEEDGKETFVKDGYNTYDFTIEEAGDYRLKGFYRHPGETMIRELNPVDFTVKYEKRHYPLSESVEIINIDSAQTFTEAYINEVVKTKLLETVKLSEKAGEKAFSDGSLVIKNAQNKTVTAKTKVTSGTYVVTYQIGEHENYLSETTATLKIVNYTSAEVDYKVLQEQETLEGKVSVLANNDEKGRTAGAAVAYIQDGTENISVYTDHVLIIPQFNVPDALMDTEKIVNIEQFKTLLGTEYTVEVTAKESGSKKLLNLNVQEDGYIYVTANETGTGKSTIVITTTVKSEDKTLAAITKKISNFIVAKGTTGAVKEIQIKVKEKDATIGSAENIANSDSFLLSKESADRYYDLTETLVMGYDDEFNGALTWKSSNSKIVAVTAAKDGTVTLKVPKNAQGVAEITATAKDAGKKSAEFKVIIVDTEVRLDTTSITMNSLKDMAGVIWLYPNTLSEKVNGENNITKIEILEKVKIGKNYEYQEHAAFLPVSFDVKDYSDASFYDYKTGELALRFTGKQSKAKTHTVYLRVTQSYGEQEFVSKEMKVTVKDKWSWPTTSAKALKAYETSYENGFAEVLITTDESVVMVGDVPAITMAAGQQFEIYKIEEYSRQNGKIVWKVKLEKNTEAVLPKKKNSTISKTVKFHVNYQNYHTDAAKEVSTKITVSNKTPEMKLYGANAFAPVFYTDAGLRYTEVVLTMPETVVEQLKDGEWDIIDGKYAYYKNNSGDILLNIALKDSSKFAIEHVYSTEKHGDVPVKKGVANISGAIVLRVKVLATKTALLQFTVSGKQFGENANYSTKTLVITKKTVSSEAVSLKDVNNNTVKSLTFSKTISGIAMAGKESIVLTLPIPESVQNAFESGETDYGEVNAVVEGNDKNSKAMLESKALLVSSTGNKVRITTMDNAFNYKNCKLKVNLQVIGENGEAHTKSSILTLNFKAAQTPTIQLTAKGTMYKGFKETANGNYYESAGVNISAKLSKMPVGYKITNIRFADPSDEQKYLLVTKKMPNGGLDSGFQLKQKKTQLSSGKDSIGIVYDVRAVGGETVSVKTTVSLKIGESASFKSTSSGFNLYNSVGGIDYGKLVGFYDAKGNAIEIVEIVNEKELIEAGIRCKITDGIDGSKLLTFYVVDDTAARGVEKTYIVKVKVGLINGFVDGENADDYSKPKVGLTKTFNIKVNLKK